MDTEKTERTKRSVGRPKKYLGDVLPEDWKEQVLGFAAEGLSHEEIYLKFYRINPYLFEKLCERETEFLDTVKKADKLCRGWWIEKGRLNLKTPNFHDALWYMNMKNRFGWKDRQEVDLGLQDSLLEKYKDLNASELLGKAREISAGIFGAGGGSPAAPVPKST